MWCEVFFLWMDILVVWSWRIVIFHLLTFVQCENKTKSLKNEQIIINVIWMLSVHVNLVVGLKYLVGKEEEYNVY